jgi:hypothetical protein
VGEEIAPEGISVARSKSVGAKQESPMEVHIASQVRAVVATKLEIQHRVEQFHLELRSRLRAAESSVEKARRELKRCVETTKARVFRLDQDLAGESSSFPGVTSLQYVRSEDLDVSKYADAYEAAVQTLHDAQFLLNMYEQAHMGGA